MITLFYYITNLNLALKVANLALYCKKQSLFKIGSCIYQKALVRLVPNLKLKLTFRDVMKILVSLLLVAAVLTSCSTNEKASCSKSCSSAATANKFISTLNPSQKKLAVMNYDSKERHNWHFFPLKTRKGLIIKDMSKEQHELTLDLLGKLLSKVGLERALAVMDLETILYHLENKAAKRDSKKYYLTLFGTPGQGFWGVSYEGHHLSMNFVVNGEELVSATPLMYGVNPAKVVNTGGTKFPLGYRLLAEQEDLGIKLFDSLTPQQKKVTHVSKGAPPAMEGYNAHPGPREKVGLSTKKLSADQKELLMKVLYTFTENAEKGFAEESNYEFKAEFDEMYFAWYGKGKARSFRIEGPETFILFHNFQPDSLGNVNHVHSLWRNRTKDFGYNIKK